MGEWVAALLDQNLNWKVTKYSFFVEVSLTTKMAFTVDAVEFFG